MKKPIITDPTIADNMVSKPIIPTSLEASWNLSVLKLHLNRIIYGYLRDDKLKQFGLIT